MHGLSLDAVCRVEAEQAVTARHTQGAGRFAPSPSGPLHQGSLVTALASHLDARSRGQQWLVRMEDLDPPREQPGAARLILQQLQDHGLQWDLWPGTESPDSVTNGVLFQSTRDAAYAAALADLARRDQVFVCRCTRRQLEGHTRYPGTCREAHHPATGPHAWRVRGTHGAIASDDFVVKRADGFWAYHLAVVVDDAFQGITHIVRGDDLAAELPRHRWLQAALGLPEPAVLHIPVLRNAQGEKLSKQTQAPAVTGGDRVHAQLREAWNYLEQVMPRAVIEQWARVSRPS